MTQGLAGYQPMARTKQTSPMMMQPNQGLASRAAATPTVPPQSAPQPQSVTRGVSPDPPGRGVVQGGLAGARPMTQGTFTPVGTGDPISTPVSAPVSSSNGGPTSAAGGQGMTPGAPPQGYQGSNYGPGFGASGVTPAGNSAGSNIDPWNESGVPRNPNASGQSSAASSSPLGSFYGATAPNQLGSGNPSVQYGGVLGQSNATANQYGLLAGQANQNMGPQVDMSGANYFAGQANGGLNLMGQTAMGGGAAQQAAAATNAQATSNALNSGMALANSSRGGGPSGAAAMANAQQGATQTIAQGGLNAAQTQAQMAANAQQGYVQGAMGEQGQQYAQQMGLAGLQQAQTAQNAQIAQGYYGLGNSVEAQQLQADQNVYANNAGLAGTAMTVGAQQNSAAISAGTGATVGLLSALGSAAAA